MSETIEFTLPKLGPEMESGMLSEWLVAEGDVVEAGQPLATIETDKVNTDLEAPAAGRIGQLVEAGDEYPIGATLAVIGGPAGPTSAAARPGPADGADPVDERLASATTPSGDVTTPIPESARSAPGPSGSPGPGSVDGGAAGASPASTTPADARVARTEARRGEPLASPVARRMARAHGVDLVEVRREHPAGTIRKRHVAAVIAAREAGPAGSGDAIPLSAMRRRIAERMRSSLLETAQITDFREHDVSELVAFRQAGVRWASALGFRPSFTDLLVRASALALRAVPSLNVSLADDRRLVQHDGIHVGVAVAVPDGLVVPVVRDAERHSLAELHARIVALVERARTGQLGLEELSGGTFTVSNIGSYGSQIATPILFPGQVGIVATGTFVRKPVVRDGEIVVGTTMATSLTIDHRVVDGETAGRFQNEIGQLLQHPERLL